MIHKFIRERRHRLPREDYRGQIWGSFTACVHNQSQIFTTDKIVAAFVEILDWACTRNDCVALLYCFMPDHLHVIFQGQSEHADLYKTMVDFKQKSGFFLRANRSHSRWQKGFYDHLLRSEKQLARALRYVAENPVRLGLVAHWQDYPFTSSIGVSMSHVCETML